MSPLGKGLLASALTLPLVAFVAGVLASPESVDPDRSRPVIIGQVNDDQPTQQPTQSPPRGRQQPPGVQPRDEPPRDPAGDDAEDGPDDGRGDAVTDDQPYTVVTPPPRDLDDDDDDGDDDGDDDTDREGSGDD